jgi:hypothetical protein
MKIAKRNGVFVLKISGAAPESEVEPLCAG